MEQMSVIVLGGLFIFLGFVGCVVPVLPGPPLAYCALLVPFLFGGVTPTETLVVCGVVVVVAQVLDYVLPTVFAKKFKCSASGIVGCVLGTIVGLFFLPWGLVVGPFAGTVLGELTAGKNLAQAAKGGVGALLGFLFGVFLKLAVVGFVAWKVIGQ